MATVMMQQGHVSLVMMEGRFIRVSSLMVCEAA